MFAVVVTGPPGSGKSTVTGLLHDALGDSGVAVAVVEIDELERCYPQLDPERTLRHVALLCASFAEAGYKLVLLTATIEDDGYRLGLLDAIGAADHLLVRLTAEPATLRARILEREPPDWSGLEDLVESSARLAESMPGLPGVDVVISTEGGGPRQVAAQIGGAIRERGYLPSPS